MPGGSSSGGVGGAAGGMTRRVGAVVAAATAGRGPSAGVASSRRSVGAAVPLRAASPLGVVLFDGTAVPCVAVVPFGVACASVAFALVGAVAPLGVVLFVDAVAPFGVVVSVRAVAPSGVVLFVGALGCVGAVVSLAVVASGAPGVSTSGRALPPMLGAVASSPVVPGLSAGAGAPRPPRCSVGRLAWSTARDRCRSDRARGGVDVPLAAAPFGEPRRRTRVDGAVIAPSTGVRAPRVRRAACRPFGAVGAGSRRPRRRGGFSGMVSLGWDLAASRRRRASARF